VHSSAGIKLDSAELWALVQYVRRCVNGMSEPTEKKKSQLAMVSLAGGARWDRAGKGIPRITQYDKKNKETSLGGHQTEWTALTGILLCCHWLPLDCFVE
jgi:hypothetical protein